MFYAHYVLSKKGPLAKVWLAAHWDKKLTKAHVFETDVEKTVDNIISPKVKMALRTSGHLLLGVVRIYSRKQKYLIQDLGEACAKIKMAFRPGVVDLPMEGTVANTDTITLPEIFHDLESAVADLNTLDIDEQMVMHRSRAEEITLKDDFLGSTGMFNLDNEFQSMENEFGGMLEDIEIPRKSVGLEKSEVSEMSQISLPTGNDKSRDDNLMEVDKKRDGPDEFGDFGGGFGDFGQGGLQEDLLNIPGLDDINLDQPPQTEDMEVDPNQGMPHPQVSDVNEEKDKEEEDKELRDAPMEEDAPIIPPNDTMKEGDGFILEPIDVTFKMRQKRKRKLVVDVRKELTGDMIRAQLRDSSDILQPKLVPPPSKKALLWKEFGVSDYLLHNPTVTSLSSELVYLVCSNLDKNIGEDVTLDGTVLQDLEDPDVEAPRRKGSEVNESVVNESVVPAPTSPTNPGSMPPQYDPQLEDEREELPPNIDFIDNIDLEGEAAAAKVIPNMPDLEEEEDEEEEEKKITEESEGNLTQSSSDQQGSEKTDEFEQRRWTKRAQQMLHMLEKGFSKSDDIQFSTLTKKCSRKQAASRFYTCLLLGKEGAVEFSQDEPYSSISITRGSLYSQLLS